MAEIFLHTAIVIVLLSIFTINQSSAQLICWQCNPCPVPFDNSSSSVSAATCSTSQTVCVTNTVRVLNRASQVSKGCVSSCTPSSSNFFGQGAFVDCCNTNYCNLSTRNQFSLSYMIIFGFIFYYYQHHHQ